LIGDLPIKNGAFPWFFVRLPEDKPPFIDGLPWFTY
jgi:hypothetical protein